MNIQNLKQDLLTLINNQCIIKINICIGNISKNIMTHDINTKTFNTYLNFIKNKIKNKKKEYKKKYYYKDMILVCNKNKKYCLKELDSQYLNYTINNTKYNKNINNIRIKINNHRIIDILNFPSIKKYDNIDNSIQSFTSNLKTLN